MSKQQFEDIAMTSIGAQAVANAEALEDYARALVAQGLLEGVAPNVHFDARAREILSALHHVLAGGDVDVRVVTEGARELLAELERGCDRVEDVLGQMNPGQDPDPMAA